MKRNFFIRVMLLLVVASALFSVTACKSDEDKAPATTETLVSSKMLGKLRSVELSTDDLSGYSAAELRLLRNAIFASHGYIFKSQDLKEYFAKFDWYNPAYTDVTAQLSPIEKRNIETIKAKEDGNGDFFRDARDGKTYKYVVIGRQTWMAENLNYKMAGSACGKNDPSCKRLGRLYTWPAAKKACPSGWHLPSLGELNVLLSAVGGANNEYDGYCNLVESTGDWKRMFGDGSCGRNQYGFSIKYDEQFLGAVFWTSTYNSEDDPAYGSYPVYYGPTGADGAAYEDDHLNVRCVKN